MNRILKTIQHSLLFAISLLSCSCAIQLEDCAGPLVNTQNLLSIQADRFLEGPQAYLVLPNPIDSPRLKLFDISQLNESSFRSAQLGVGLPELQNSMALENSFLKVRLNSRFDSAEKLVKLSELNSASNDVQDPKYSQVMAYHGISAITDYVESLGFSIDRSRELYVMVRSNEDPDSQTLSPPTQDINAYYVHNTYHPEKPRYIQLFGNVNYPLGADRDVFWHEFGHLFNESLSANRGIDDASERGASYMEGGAIHECIADYLSESASNKPYIGKWAARNISQIPAGQPLRSALNQKDGKDLFGSVNTFQNDIPEKYHVAEWCTRVLWDIRSQFEKEDSKTGKLFSDRVLFSAVSLLGKNASFSQLREAILYSDQQLHCGLHQTSIKKAFSSRGFQENVPALSEPLIIQAQPIGFKKEGNEILRVAPSSQSDEILFSLVMSNPTNRLARNVRLELLSNDPAVLVYANVQGFGDLPARSSIRVGEGGAYTDHLSSVSFGVDPQYLNGRNRIKVFLKITIENGPSTLKPVEVNL